MGLVSGDAGETCLLVRIRGVIGGSKVVVLAVGVLPRALRTCMALNSLCMVSIKWFWARRDMRLARVVWVRWRFRHGACLGFGSTCMARLCVLS